MAHVNVFHFNVRKNACRCFVQYILKPSYVEMTKDKPAI